MLTAGNSKLVCPQRGDDSIAAKSRVSREFEATIDHSERSLYLAEDANGECLGYILVHWIPFPLIMGHEGYTVIKKADPTDAAAANHGQQGALIAPTAPSPRP